LKELLLYSLPRVQGHFALAGLFALGPIVAAHLVSVQEVGYLSVSQSLLNMLVLTVGPLSTITLPLVSAMAIQEKHGAIQENMDILVGAVIQCFLFLTVQLFIFADTIIKYWLGPEFTDAIIVMRIVFLSVPFYALYVALRNILEAIKFKPINTVNLFISLAVFSLVGGVLLLSFSGVPTIISLSIAFTSGLICLGALTYYSIRKIYPQKIRMDLNYLWIAVVINALLGAIALLAKPYVISRFYYPILFEIALGTIYLLTLWGLKVDWLREIMRKLGLKN
jgi:O-antigen/teichoic acid export membrane protein